MAITTITASGGDRSWGTSATWDNGVPGVADTAVGDGSSGTVGLGSTPSTIASLDLSSYTSSLQIDNATLDVDGPVSIGSNAVLIFTNGSQLAVAGNFDMTSGASITTDATSSILFNDTGTITTNGVNIGNVLANTAGTHTQADLINGGSIDVQAGTLNSASFGSNWSGDCKRTGGVWTDSGVVTLSGSTPREIENALATERWDHLVIDSATCTMTADTFAMKLSGAGTIVADTTEQFILWNGAAGFWAGWSGTITSDVRFRTSNTAPGADVVLTGGDLSFVAPPGVSLPMDAALNLNNGSLRIFSESTGGSLVTVATGANPFTGHVVLGDDDSGVNRSGVFDCGSGNHIIKSLSRDPANTFALLNAVDFATSTVNLSGKFDGNVSGNDIIVTNTSAVISGAGTFTDTTVTDNELNATNMRGGGPNDNGDGGSNVNIRFRDLSPALNTRLNSNLNAPLREVI